MVCETLQTEDNYGFSYETICSLSFCIIKIWVKTLNKKINSEGKSPQPLKSTPEPAVHDHYVKEIEKSW